MRYSDLPDKFDTFKLPEMTGICSDIRQRPATIPQPADSCGTLWSPVLIVANHIRLYREKAFRAFTGLREGLGVNGLLHGGIITIIPGVVGRFCTIGADGVFRIVPAVG